MTAVMETTPAHAPAVSGAVSADRLRTFVERIEKVEANIKEETEFRKDIYAEAKGEGFNVAVIRRLVSLRKKDSDAVVEEMAELELYAGILGMDLGLSGE